MVKLRRCEGSYIYSEWFASYIFREVSIVCDVFVPSALCIAYV